MLFSFNLSPFKSKWTEDTNVDSFLPLGLNRRIQLYVITAKYQISIKIEGHWSSAFEIW